MDLFSHVPNGVEEKDAGRHLWQWLNKDSGLLKSNMPDPFFTRHLPLGESWDILIHICWSAGCLICMPT